LNYGERTCFTGQMRSVPHRAFSLTGRTADGNRRSMHMVPRGTLHNPVADDECWIVLIEPVQTKHTGDVEAPLTRTIYEQLR